MERWRQSRFAEVVTGAFAVALGISAAVVVIVACLVGFAVIGDLVAQGVRR